MKQITFNARSNWTELLAISAALVLLFSFLSISKHLDQAKLAVAISLSFAFVAWLLKGVDTSGALAGAAVSFIFFVSGGWRLLTVLLFVFVITLVATEVAKYHSRSSGQSRGRSASQVLANLLVPTAFLIFAERTISQPLALAAVIAALAELAADTVSSEIGEWFGNPTYLLTTFKNAKAGTDGGISAIGTLAGVGSALSVAGAAWVLGLMGSRVWICAATGLVGMFADSLLGATLERRGWLNNNTVNLTSTAVAAVLAWALLVHAP